MFNDVKSNPRWTQITIDDKPECLTGKNVLKILHLISSVLKLKYIILGDIEGYGKFGLIRSFQEREHEVLLFEDFCQELFDVGQFDWGDFFLFENYPLNWDESVEGYPVLVVQTDTTVRCVDDQYFYIYTPHEEVISLIKQNYEIESMRTGLLKHLEYP